MVKKCVCLLLAGLILGGCAFSEECKIVHKSVKYYENKIYNEKNDDVCMYYNLAKEYVRKNNLQQALNTYDSIIEKDNQEEKAYLHRWLIYTMNINENMANIEAARLVKNIPDSKFGNDLLADIYAKIFDYERALKYVNKAIELNGDELPILFYNRGNIYKGLGEYSKAIDDYTKYIGNQLKNNEKDYWWISVVYEERAECYKALGKTKEAESDMQKKEEYYNKREIKNYTIFNQISWKYNALKRKRYAGDLL